MGVNFVHDAKQFSIKTCRPGRDGVLIRTDRGKEKTEGGIWIPETAQDKACTGVIVKVGLPAINEFGVEIPIPLKKDDKVIFSKFSGQEIAFEEDDYEYKIIPSKLIFGVIEKQEE